MPDSPLQILRRWREPKLRQPQLDDLQDWVECVRDISRGKARDAMNADPLDLLDTLFDIVDDTLDDVVAFVTLHWGRP